MIFAILDRFTTKKSVEFISVAMLVSPLADCIEHVTLNLNVVVSDGGMVERAEDIVGYLIDRNIRVLPRVQYTAVYGLVGMDKWIWRGRPDLRYDVLQHSGCDSARAWIENVGEVVL